MRLDVSKTIYAGLKLMQKRRSPSKIDMAQHYACWIGCYVSRYN